MTTRREFFQALAAGAAAAASPWPRRVEAQTRSDPWQELPRVLARIKPPVFPARDFDAARDGAGGDNTKDNTNPFRDAIPACARAGGGRVVVPAGEFVTGAIELKSGVNLHVSQGPPIPFTPDQTRIRPG